MRWPAACRTCALRVKLRPKWNARSLAPCSYHCIGLRSGGDLPLPFSFVVAGPVVERAICPPRVQGSASCFPALFSRLRYGRKTDCHQPDTQTQP